MMLGFVPQSRMASCDHGTQSSSATEPSEEGRRHHRSSPQGEGPPFSERVNPGGFIREIVVSRRFGGLVSEVEQDAGNVDVHGTHLSARAAQAARAGKLGGGVHSGHLWSQDRSDRSWIHASVGVTADLSIDGADVEAGAAANATQGLGRHILGQKLGSTVVDEYDVHFVRAVVFRRGPGSRHQGLVAADRLSGATSGDESDQGAELFEGWNDLLDSRDRHVHSWK